MTALNDMATLNEETLALIVRHAEQAYPKECCGFVYADGEVRACVNIQDDLKSIDPARYRHGATAGYTLSVADTLALNGSFETANPASVIYHSHPDVGAYFSQEDSDEALFLGTPVYPVDYLVVDVRRAKALEAKLFVWRKAGFFCARVFPIDQSYREAHARRRR
ncbi:Mov34/MPN/PAD-1 family protein [Rhodopseudomonas palustris]|uniref:JAB domain-containing protein n=1 Tax=Rhodopseudomonas palustris (strain BisB18) TaxID=316056 RepID=Q216W0_RHOPB